MMSTSTLLLSRNKQGIPSDNNVKLQARRVSSFGKENIKFVKRVVNTKLLIITTILFTTIQSNSGPKLFLIAASTQTTATATTTPALDQIQFEGSPSPQTNLDDIDPHGLDKFMDFAERQRQFDQQAVAKAGQNENFAAPLSEVNQQPQPDGHKKEGSHSNPPMQVADHVNSNGSQTKQFQASMLPGEAQQPTATQALIENPSNLETIVPVQESLANLRRNEKKLDVNFYGLPKKQLLQIDGGFLKTISKGVEDFELENQREPGQLSSSLTNQAAGLERRFGLFKKGHHQNNNFPFSKFNSQPGSNTHSNGMALGETTELSSAYINECERCFANTGHSNIGTSPQNPTWMFEHSPMQKYQHSQSIRSHAFNQHSQTPFSPHLAHIKSKLNNKFQYIKPSNSMGDLYHGQSRFPVNYKSKTALIGRPAPYQATQQPFNCVLTSGSEQSLADGGIGRNGGGGGAVMELLDQSSIEE